MITCLVVDDEPGAINVLKNHIEKTSFLEMKGTASNPIEAIKLMQRQRIDLLFLDIQMPILSGIDFLKVIGDKCKVILYTASREFAFEGFEHHQVLDYLLKPVPYDRFLRSAQRGLEFYSDSCKNETRSPALEEGHEYLFIKTENKGKIVKIYIKDIFYIEGLGNYVSLYTKEDKIVVYCSFKKLEKMLPSTFIRVHKSYLVSMDFIHAVDGNQVLLKGCKVFIPLGATYRAIFFERLQKKIIGGK